MEGTVIHRSSHPDYILYRAHEGILENGEATKVIVDHQGYIADRATVQALLEACVEQLRVMSDKDIRESNEAYQKERDERLLEECRESAARARRAEPRRGFVYLMRDQINGRHKIGFSRNPRYRESTLQSEKPDVILIGVKPGSMGDEEALHDKYRHRRIRGEWFELSEGELQEVLAGMEAVK
jgi:hypothetical protein